MSQSLVVVFVQKPVSVPDDDVEFEKLMEASNEHLNEVISYRSLCYVMIPKTFLSACISTIDNAANNPAHHIDLGTLYYDEIVVAGSKSEIYCLNKVDDNVFYDNFHRA